MTPTCDTDGWSDAAKAYPKESMTRRSGRDDMTADSDGRSPFARDRDRLVYSDAFSSLCHKSQVAASTSLGPFHNRMTHSLKVGQLGRRIAERISRRTGGRPSAGPDPDLVEMCCLAHDIGHPPFGHTGELALAESVDRAIGSLGPVGQDARERGRRMLRFGGFEGNPQTLRVVTRLSQKRVADRGAGTDLRRWNGLDPTAAGTDAICKYPWARESLRQDKWGVYGAGEDSDSGTLDWARRITGAPTDDPRQTSFECQIMDWCDDVTYAVHDVDDFHRAGMIPMHLLFGTNARAESQASGKAWEHFCEAVGSTWNSAGRWAGAGEAAIADRLKELRTSLAASVPDLVSDGVYDDRVTDLRDSSVRTSRLIEHFTRHVLCDPDGVPRLHEGRLLLHPDPHEADLLRDQCNMLQELIRVYVIGTPAMQDMRRAHHEAVSDLFEFFLERQDLLPMSYQEIAEHGSGHDDPGEARIRITADYVASLTEPAALSFHRRIYDGEVMTAREPSDPTGSRTPTAHDPA